MDDSKKYRANRARLKKKIIVAVWILGIIGVVAGLTGALVGYSRWKEKNIPGVVYESQGQDHVPLGKEFAYNSNPPSSGPHYAQPANWGVYDFEVNDQIFIHNLEHGGIWIAYRPSVPKESMDQLREIVSEFGGSKLVMAPRSANDADVAVVSWRRVLKFNLTDGSLTDDQKNQIITFYKSLKDHAPEFVPDDMPGIDPKSAK